MSLIFSFRFKNHEALDWLVCCIGVFGTRTNSELTNNFILELIFDCRYYREDESKSRIGPSSSKSGPPPPQPPQPPLMRSVAMPVPPPHMHMPRSQPTAVPPPPNPVAPAPQVLRLPPQGVPAPQGLMLAPRPPMMMMQQAPQPMLRPTHMLGTLSIYYISSYNNIRCFLDIVPNYFEDFKVHEIIQNIHNIQNWFEQCFIDHVWLYQIYSSKSNGWSAPPSNPWSSPYV